ncbi:MAG: hypothetical protein ACRENU_13465 [Gemmatimonadaceae bacterium]
MKTFSVTLGLLVAGTAEGQRAGTMPDPQTVVFVCEHGTSKSVIAMAWFDSLARARGLPFRAASRATAPDASIPEFVREGLKADGFDLSGFTPMPLRQLDLRAALVVSFDQPSVAQFADRSAPVTAWDNLPSVSAHYATARDSIKQRVAALVDSLARKR